MTRHAVLVFSSDPLAAALLGASIELSGHDPHFPHVRESSRSALLRVRPKLVLIDCDHEESCSETFVGPALMTGSKVLLFRSRRTERDIGDLADRLGVTVMDLPGQHQTLSEMLRRRLA